VDRVFLLWHVHKIADDNEDEKLIGVYRTETDAKAAIVRLQDKPGFVQCREGFLVEWYELNKDHWAEGYATVP
jgi:hypothetical protein